MRVKRPGVDVRARRGYRSATEEEVTAERKAANPPTTSSKDAVTTAMSGLSRLRPDWRFSMNAVPMTDAGSKGVDLDDLDRRGGAGWRSRSRVGQWRKCLIGCESGGRNGDRPCVHYSRQSHFTRYQ